VLTVVNILTKRQIASWWIFRYHLFICVLQERTYGQCSVSVVRPDIHAWCWSRRNPIVMRDHGLWMGEVCILSVEFSVAFSSFFPCRCCLQSGVVSRDAPQTVSSCRRVV
jgi:hypothetical protein